MLNYRVLYDDDGRETYIEVFDRENLKEAENYAIKRDLTILNISYLNDGKIFLEISAF